MISLNQTKLFLVQIKLKALSTISNSLKFTNATENSDNNSLLRIYTKPTLETEIAEKIANQRNQRLNEILNWIQVTILYVFFSCN